MLDTLANSGAEIDDTPLILQRPGSDAADRQPRSSRHRRGEISLEDVFDRDYLVIEGTNPAQYDNRFCDFADQHVRRCSTAPRRRRAASSARRSPTSTAICRPTFASAASRRAPIRCGTTRIAATGAIFIDESPARPASDKPAMLATYRMELGDKNIPVKNVFVPLFVKGRRWGNFELAYRDD